MDYDGMGVDEPGDVHPMDAEDFPGVEGDTHDPALAKRSPTIETKKTK